MAMPVAVPHQIAVATTQIIRSIQMPAMDTAIRAHLPPYIQTCEESQKKLGAKYIRVKPIFSTLAPKCLQVRPCPVSWANAIAANRNQNSTRSVVNLKNSKLSFQISPNLSAHIHNITAKKTRLSSTNTGL